MKEDQLTEKIATDLATWLGIESLRSGQQVIRNEKGWRDNEKQLEYVWFIHMDRLPMGQGGLFAAQYREWQFRDIINPDELIQGIYWAGKDGITDLYMQPATIPDTIRQLPFPDLFNAGDGFVIDGILYTFRIAAPGIDTAIHLNNPRTPAWQKWEAEVWTLGKYLAALSGKEEMIRLFA